MRSKRQLIREALQDPKGVLFRTIDNLIDSSFTMGLDKELKEHMKEKHPWLFND